MNKKIAYSVINAKNGFKYKGIGEMTEEDIYLNQTDRNGNQIILEDSVRYCHKIFNKENEYKGTYEMYVECDLEDDRGRITTREIIITYYIWFKILED